MYLDNFKSLYTGNEYMYACVLANSVGPDHMGLSNEPSDQCLYYRYIVCLLLCNFYVGHVNLFYVQI